MQKASEQQELLTDRQTGELCGVSARHVVRQAQLGKFPAPVRIGAAVRWRRSTVLAWLDQQEGNSNAKP